MQEGTVKSWQFKCTWSDPAQVNKLERGGTACKLQRSRKVRDGRPGSQEELPFSRSAKEGQQWWQYKESQLYPLKTVRDTGLWEENIQEEHKTTEIFVGLLCGREIDMVHQKEREMVRAKSCMLQGNLFELKK